VTVTGGEELRVDVTDGVAVVTLDRPKARNALTIQLRDDLLRVVRECRADDDVRAVLVTGAGGSFCAGMDLSASSAATAGTPEHDPRAMDHALHVGVHALVTELWDMDKPTVAAVDGAAVGPGAHLALACDFVLVQPDSKFLWSFSKIGLVVDAGGAYLLPRLVGLPRAKAMVMLGEGSVGQQAVDDGLAYECVAADQLMDKAMLLATRLAAGPTRAIGMSKRLLNHSFESPLAVSLQLEGAYQALATASADLVEGLQAMRESRDAKFRGR
jgi:2-(1,2-epoxy-1,2-dihydrophenyl)acetyl-CoA isomerase